MFTYKKKTKILMIHLKKKIKQIILQPTYAKRKACDFRINVNYLFPDNS